MAHRRFGYRRCARRLRGLGRCRCIHCRVARLSPGRGSSPGDVARADGGVVVELGVRNAVAMAARLLVLGAGAVVAAPTRF